MSLFAPGFDDQPALHDLTVHLSQLMFPIVVLLALSGLVVGMLNSFDHFSVPALAPVAWNAVIIAALVGLVPVLPHDDRIYAYAIGILVGTVVQFALPLPWLRGRGGHLTFGIDWRDPRVLAGAQADAPGHDRARADQPEPAGQLAVRHARLGPGTGSHRQGVSHLPAAAGAVLHLDRHVLFPTLARFAARGARDDLRRTMANGVRQICLLLIPSAVLMAVLAEPITRLVYQRGAFGGHATDLVSEAMVWWAISLPFQGVSLLFSRTFFSLQRPWATTSLAGLNLLVNAVLAAALHGPLGIAGIVIGTVAGTVAMCVAQGLMLRGDLGGVEGRRTAGAAGLMLLASAPLAAASYGVWHGLDAVLGQSFAAQAVAVLSGIAAGVVVYAAAVWALRVPEARQIRRLLMSRGRPG